METQIITLSKSATIIKCCIIVLAIAMMISLSGTITLNEFISNILDWESI
jgi:hypothetical protein